MSYNWQNILVTPDKKIKDALEIINNEGLRVAIVVDNNKRLLGIITDGDIRRGLLKNLSLTDSLSAVMNVNPITAKLETSKEQLHEIMKAKDILAIPLVDENKVVVGLDTLHYSFNKIKYDNPIFIMAGGFGKRLQPLTNDCPKPMLKIGNKPILETVIREFIKNGFYNFYISTHYMPEQIYQHFGDGSSLGINIHYVYEETPLGTGGALGLLPEVLSKGLPIIMMNGDLLTKIDFHRLLDFHEKNNADVTMCVREYEYQIPYGVIKNEENRVVSMVEKPVERFFINAGVYVISPKVIKYVKKDQHIDMPTLLEHYIKKGKNILMFPIYEYWLDIGRMDDFNRAQSDFFKLGL